MRKYNLSIIIFIFVIAIFSNISQASAKKISKGRFEVKEYQIDVSSRETEGRIFIRGRISYGPYCDNLKIKFTLENESGTRKSISAEVKDVGGSGTRIIKADKKISKKTDSDTDWEIVDISVSCKK